MVEITYGPHIEQGTSNPLLRHRTFKAVDNFYALPLSDIAHKHNPEEISNVAERVWETVSRNNQISEILNSERFQKLKERKEELRGETELALIWCVDGRLDGMSMGVLVDIWEVPGGMINVYKGRDSSVLPRSAELREHIKDDASSNRELL